MKDFRLVVSLLVAFLLAAMPSAAAADTRDIETFDIPFLPCMAGVPDVGVPPSTGTGANDGAFPHVCFVRFLAPPGTLWQASTGEWILFHVRLGFATEAACAQFAATTSVSIEFRGAAVAFDTLPCQQPPPPFPNLWVVSFRLLTHPVPPGTYSATLTLTPPGGPTTTLTQSVTVIPNG